MQTTYTLRSNTRRVRTRTPDGIQNSETIESIDLIDEGNGYRLVIANFPDLETALQATKKLRVIVEG